MVKKINANIIIYENNKTNSFFILLKIEKKTPHFLKFYKKNTPSQADNPYFKIASLRLRLKNY